MAILKFEDIIAWQKAQDLAVDIYFSFKNSRDFGFKDQICRAVVSISNNVAEGFDRSSNKEFARFLYYSSASCSEVRSMLYLAFRLKYLSLQERNIYLEKCTEISKIIYSLTKSLNTT